MSSQSEHQLPPDSKPRLNILISAYYCSPYRGGESAVGWKVASGLAKHHDVTVICGDLSGESPTRADLVRLKEEGGMAPGLRIEHIQAEGLTRVIHDLHALPGMWFLFYEAYRRWQKQALAKALHMHAERPFDLAHHVNVIGFREPGYLWQMGIPFFWGPVSGAPMVPPTYLADFGVRERFRWTTRNALNHMQFRIGGRPARAARASAAVWAVSQEDRAVLARWGVAAEQMLETGCTPAPEPRVRSLDYGSPLRICWSGLFQGIKALPLLLHAMASSPTLSGCTLEILGSGPEESRWKSLAQALGLGHCVTWRGMMARNEAIARMNDCDVLVHTSVKEGTPHVVLEALAMGMPVICHDACGMGAAVTPECGITIPMKDPGHSITGFASALQGLLSDPGRLTRLSQGAIRRSGQLTWDEKIQCYSRAYRAHTGESPV